MWFIFCSPAHSTTLERSLQNCFNSTLLEGPARFKTAIAPCFKSKALKCRSLVLASHTFIKLEGQSVTAHSEPDSSLEDNGIKAFFRGGLLGLVVSGLTAAAFRLACSVPFRFFVPFTKGSISDWPCSRRSAALSFACFLVTSCKFTPHQPWLLVQTTAHIDITLSSERCGGLHKTTVQLIRGPVSFPSSYLFLILCLF